MFSRLVEKGRVTEEESVTFKHASTERVLISKPSLDAMWSLKRSWKIWASKQPFFSRLRTWSKTSVCLPQTPLLLSVTALARGCAKPNRVLGLHFFNPAPLMALVEVIPALQTQQGLAEHAIAQMTAWGKAPAHAKDTPGFIVNRVARPFYSEALRILEEGLASVEDIDASMRAQGFRMGPFELMDLIGHDVNYAVTSTVHQAFYGDSRYRPSHTQRQLVAADWLGRKRNRGFYVYEEGKRMGPEGKRVEGVAERILAMLMNEAADAVFWQVATPSDVDTAMRKGVNYPEGLLAWADKWGVQELINILDSLRQRYGEERYKVSPLLRDMAREGRRFFE